MPKEKLVLIPRPEPRIVTYFKTFPPSLIVYTFVIICVLFYASYTTSLDYNTKYIPSPQLLEINNTLSTSPVWFPSDKIPAGYTAWNKYDTCTIGNYITSTRIPKDSFPWGFFIIFSAFALVMTHIITRKSVDTNHVDLLDSKREAMEFWANADLKEPGKYGKLVLTEPLLQMRVKEKVVGNTSTKTNLIFGEVRKKDKPPFYVCFEFNESTGKIKGLSKMDNEPSRYDFCGKCGHWADERIIMGDDLKQAGALAKMFRIGGTEK